MDKYSYRLAISCVAFTAIISTCSVIALAIISKPIPQELVSLTLGAFAPLAAFLVPTRS